MGKNCDGSLEYDPRPKAEGRAQFFPTLTKLAR